MEAIPEINVFDPKTESASRRLLELFANLTRNGLMKQSEEWLREFQSLIFAGTPIPYLSYGTSLVSEIQEFCLVLSRLLEKGEHGRDWNSDDDPQDRRKLLINASGYQMDKAIGGFMWMYLIHIPVLSVIIDIADSMEPLTYCQINPAFKKFLLGHPHTKFEPHYTHPENSALHVAVALDDPELVTELLKIHDVNTIGFFKDCPISWAVLMCRMRVLPILLDKGAVLTNLTPANFTVAHWIAGAWIDASQAKRELFSKVWAMIKDQKTLVETPCKILSLHPIQTYESAEEDDGIFSATVTTELPGLTPRDICPNPFK